MPQNKPHQVTEEQSTSPTEGTYQEIHAAIEELFRLMGVSSYVDPTGYQVPSGYSVYTYPSPTQTLPHAVAGTNDPTSSTWPNNQQVMMTTASPMNQPYGLDQFAGLPVTAGYPAWGPYLVAGCFR